MNPTDEAAARKLAQQLVRLAGDGNWSALIGRDKDYPGPADPWLGEAVERQRNRMAEIQELKNNRIVGEDHRGLLSLRQTPAGKWGDHVKRTVEEENTDRTLLMRNEAKESNRPLNEIEIEAWKLRADQSFKGEYIEVAGKTPGAFEWVQATGPKETKGTPPDKINPDPSTPPKPKP